MGFDTWSEGSDRDQYLANCRASPKYKKGQWFVLSNGTNLLSSLIIYQFAERRFGIGSIATSMKFRNKGYASKLICSVIADIEKHNPHGAIFLYSDINANFYERFEFVRVWTEERGSSSTCMVRARDLKKALAEGAPSYF